MTAVERIKAICKERRIPISRLERECGFSNGYIGQLKKGMLPADRLQIVAEYLGVAPDFLMVGAGEEKKDIAQDIERYYYDPDARAAAQEVYERPGMRVLFSAARGVSEQDLRTVATILERMKETNPDG